jgi:hypothetical protein
VSYYSTTNQLEELIYSLDEDLYEADLCEAINDIRQGLERQMMVTEELTNERKAHSRKSYFELDDGEIEHETLMRNVTQPKASLPTVACNIKSLRS